MNLRNIVAIGIVCAQTIIPVLAQTSTVGNGSAIAPSASELSDFGLNGMQSSSSNADYSTRHYRRHNESGIGGSFIGTTAPTSESSPALKVSPSSPEISSIKTFRLPKLDSGLINENSNPALESYTPALPSTPARSALVSPITTAPSFRADSANLGVENLSSFSNRSSFMNSVQPSNIDPLKQQ